MASAPATNSWSTSPARTPRNRSTTRSTNKDRCWPTTSPVGPRRASPRGLSHAAQRDSRGAPGVALASQSAFPPRRTTTTSSASPRRAASPTAREDIVIVVANLDPHSTRSSMVRLNMPLLGLDWATASSPTTLIPAPNGPGGNMNFVRLGPMGSRFTSSPSRSTDHGDAARRGESVPSKIDLVAGWIGTQRWYAARGARRSCGAFSPGDLDDPAGEVGIETLLIGRRNHSPIVYQVPLTHRSAPLGADHALCRNHRAQRSRHPARL